MRLIFALIILAMPITTLAQEQEKNFGIIERNIWYSQEQFFAGDTIRVFSAIFNAEDEAISGTLEFFSNNAVFAEVEFEIPPQQLQQVSAEWVAGVGEHTITARIKEAYLAGDESAFVLAQNKKTGEDTFDIDLDTDKDGIGNKEDEDDDNDGLTDQQEKEIGTDPLNPDTDNDGLTDGDEYSIKTNPLDDDTDNDGIKDGSDKIATRKSQEKTLDTSLALDTNSLREAAVSAGITLVQRINHFAENQATELEAIREDIKSELNQDNSKLLSSTSSRAQVASSTENEIKITGPEKNALKRAYYLFISMAYFIFEITWLFYALLLIFIYFMLKWLWRLVFRRSRDHE